MYQRHAVSVHAKPCCHGGSASGYYSGNAKTWMDAGLAMGEVMVELLKKSK